MRSQRLAAALALAVLLSALSALAQDAPRPRNADLKIATYEVGDLVVTVPDYAAPESGASAAMATSFGGGGGGFGSGGGGYDGGGGRGGGGFRGVDPNGNPAGGGQPFGAGPVSLPDLQRVITRVILPETWAVNGGGDGQIEGIGASLVVLNTQEVHQLIDGMLDTLRHGSGARRSVAVDARWLLLNSDDLDRLIKRDDKGQPTVDRTALDELTRRPTSLRGLTNCFSGQGVYLISGTRRNVVRSYIPVVGSLEQPEFNVARAAFSRNAHINFAQYGGGGGGRDGGDLGSYTGRSVGYQPVVETPNFGVLLKIRPTLMHNEEAAVVDLTSTITFPGIDTGAGMDVAPPAGAATPTVDRLAIDTQELATTLRVPLGQPVLVGGMSYIAPAGGASHEPAGHAAAGAAPSQETPQLYLVLEVR